MNQFVCLLTGDRLPEIYVEKLYSMLLRHSSAIPGQEDESANPVQLICLTDRQRRLSSPIQQIEISSYKLKSWFNKLLLFNPAVELPHEFLYLDVTLIVKGNPDRLVDFARSTEKDLVLLKDWHYDSYNTCTMWIKRSALTSSLWDAFHSGEQHKGRLNTDQDYITGYIRANKLEAEIGLFRKEDIQSYKRLLKLNRTDSREARERADRCTVLKFHGSPRPHEVLGQRYWLKRALRYPRYASKDYRFLAQEIRRWWA